MNSVPANVANPKNAIVQYGSKYWSVIPVTWAMVAPENQFSAVAIEEALS